MISLKLDLHVHTSISKDSAIPIHPRVAKILEKRGIDGIAITDHDTTYNVGRLSRILELSGLIAIPGEEVKTNEGGEILCYFIQDKIPRGTWAEVLDAVESQGGIAFLSHPFDYIRGNWMRFFTRDRIREGREILNRVAGLEAYNARNYSPNGNRLALYHAKAGNLATIAGSDAHNLFEIGVTWTVMDDTSTDIDDVASAFMKAARKGTLVPRFAEDMGRLPIPGYKARRFAQGVLKKLHSGLNSAFPAFKRWQVAMASHGLPSPCRFIGVN